MKTAISIPDDLFEAGERLARRQGISRSELYRKALASYLDNEQDSAITEALNRVYPAQGESPLDPALDAMQKASLDKEDW